MRPSVTMPQRPGAPGSVWKRSLPIYFSSLLLLGDFWKRRERCWVYPWDLGLQTRGHCGLPQPAALPPALIGYSVAVTSTRPTPFALPLCQGVTGLCLRVEFWRRSSVLVDPKLGHTSATRRLGAAHPAPTNHSGIFTASVGPRPTRRRRRCSLGGTRCSSEVRAPAQRVTGVERPAARMAGAQSGTAPGGVARPA